MRKKVSVVIILIATLTIGLVNTSGTFAKGKTPFGKTFHFHYGIITGIYEHFLEKG